MKRACWGAVLLVATIGLSPAAAEAEEEKQDMGGDRGGKVRAPEFPEGFTWLNTGGRPLSLRELRGRVVLLDFWTYCCINCMHLIPDLKFLEAKYRAEPFVAIGVHSAKFENEGDAANVRSACLRYELEHPVVVDRDMRIWRTYGVRAWPTLALIDAEGFVRGITSGEGHREALDAAIAALLAEAREKGILAHERLALALVPEPEAAKAAAARPLSFPGKVAIDAAQGRLYIADSNHNRIVATTLAGRLVATAGSGVAGRDDGALAAARFDHPQAMTLAADGALLVADTENHLVRRVDWAAGTVRTIAGTGVPAGFGARGGPALETALSSPWDLLRDGDTVYIAMAGAHQIWALDLAKGEVRVFAGSGREARGDGPLAAAAFAQPSGLATDGRGRLFVADSEVSSVRAIAIAGAGAGGKVETLVGGDLFEFGDQDGVGDAARLQHPLGVAWGPGGLFVADTYNHKVRRIDVEGRAIAGFYGGKGELYEPGGLAAGPGGKLYVADTNHHRVVVLDLATRAAAPLELEGVSAPEVPTRTAESRTRTSTSTSDEDVPVTRLRSIALKPGAKGELRVTPPAPPGEKVAPDAPIRLRAGVRGPELLRFASAEADSSALAFTTAALAEGAMPLAVVEVRVDYQTCAEKEGAGAVCRPRAARYEVAVRLDPSGKTAIAIDRPE